MRVIFNTLSKTVIFIAFIGCSDAFIFATSSSKCIIKKARETTSSAYSTDSTELHVISRRSCINSQMASILCPLAFLSAPPSSSDAMVTFDPKRYGDKELSIATSNRLRQNLRDAITKDPQIAPLFLELVIQDSLKYNVKTTEGGPDGTIVALTMEKDAPNTLKRLAPAAEVINSIVGKMSKSNSVTVADALAYAGIVAMDTFNGPKVSAQLGKLDGLLPPTNIESPKIDLFDNGKEEIVGAFRSSGLSEREIALLFGGVIALRRAVDKVSQDDKDEDEFEENEMGDEQVDIQNTFGASPFGTSIGQIDENIFGIIVEAKKMRGEEMAKVFGDEKVLDWSMKYASKKYSFSKDYPLAYRKLILLGARNTGSGIDEF